MKNIKWKRMTFEQKTYGKLEKEKRGQRERGSYIKKKVNPEEIFKMLRENKNKNHGLKGKNLY